MEGLRNNSDEYRTIKHESHNTCISNKTTPYRESVVIKTISTYESTMCKILNGGQLILSDLFLSPPNTHNISSNMHSKPPATSSHHMQLRHKCPSYIIVFNFINI
ncbi:hypothetical protein CDL12_07281 [Handroanthus impetiginosus]|uniref:Uncharacterized protein n=1 Tax=Handroanthus impetiginosus TaxID=429701 RepID=A0A2G9HR68_9LAMI|nr:hypothetical protein CDL12_07281 [Handroanthus impetiginosus]